MPRGPARTAPSHAPPGEARTGHAHPGGAIDRQATLREEIKKRWQEQTEELYKKGLNDLDNHDGVIHLEPDILECEVK